MIAKDVCCWNVVSIHLLLDGLYQLHHLLTKVSNKQGYVRL